MLFLEKSKENIQQDEKRTKKLIKFLLLQTDFNADYENVLLV